MRKLMIPAVLAAVALAGAAGCADNSPKPSSSTSASTTTAAAATTASDQTKQVCDEATSASTTAVTAVQGKLTEAAAAMGDQTKLLQIGTDLTKIAGDWSAKLTDLSTKPINPQVKSALTDGATTIRSLVDPATLPTANVAEVQTKLQGLVAKITTACAAA